MRPNTAFGARSSIAVFIVTLLTLAFLGACQSRSNQDEEDEERAAQPQKPLAQISVENGQTIIALDKPTQARLGLAIASLAETLTRAQAAFPAVVLSVQDLATLRNNYVAAQAQFQKARVGANVARQEYTRLKTLYAENQNVSQKSLQSAEGALQADEADVRAAEQQLSLERSIARQAWGGVVEQWAVDGSPEFQRILDQRAVLVQMTVSPDTSTGPTPHAMPDAVIDPPKTISLEVPTAFAPKRSLCPHSLASIPVFKAEASSTSHPPSRALRPASTSSPVSRWAGK